MARANNFPQSGLSDVPAEAVKQTVTDLRQLYDMGQPKTDQEMEERVNLFFDFCQHSSVRPGVESLCLSLHITRQTLCRWTQGIGCSKRRQEAAEAAKSFINAYLEQCSLSGKVNPVTGIFLLKNWAGYRDSYQLESGQPGLHPEMTPEEIARKIEQDIPVDTDIPDDV